MCEIFSPDIFIKMGFDYIERTGKLPKKAILAKHHIEELEMFVNEKTSRFKNKVSPLEIISFIGIPIEIGNDFTIAHME